MIKWRNCHEKKEIGNWLISHVMKIQTFSSLSLDRSKSQFYVHLHFCMNMIINKSMSSKTVWTEWNMRLFYECNECFCCCYLFGCDRKATNANKTNWTTPILSVRTVEESVGIWMTRVRKIIMRRRLFLFNEMRFLFFLFYVRLCRYCIRFFVLHVYVCVVLNWESKSRWIFCIYVKLNCSIWLVPVRCFLLWGDFFTLFHLGIFRLFFLLLLLLFLFCSFVSARLCLDGKFSWKMLVMVMVIFCYTNGEKNSFSFT